MNTTRMTLAGIRRDDRFRLSYPLRPDSYQTLAGRLPGFPLLVVDGKKRVIAGHDYLALLRQKKHRYAWMWEVDLPPAQALILNFNLKQLLTGLNLYEKLLFVKKIGRWRSPADIQQQPQLGFAVNNELLKNLDRLLAPPLKTLLQNDRLVLKSACKMLTMTGQDRSALAGLLRRVVFNENQQGRLIEMAEEIAFARKTTIAEIMRQINRIRLGRQEMPQKAILETLFRLRYPRYFRWEKEWRKQVRALAAEKGLNVCHHPFWEKSDLTVAIRAQNPQAAMEILEKLKKRTTD